MTKSNLHKIFIFIFYVLVVAVFVYLMQIVYSNWQDIKTYDFTFHPAFLILSFIFGAANVISLAWIWKKIYTKLESNTQVSKWVFCKIFIYSWIGRYLPGKLWMSFGKIFIGARYGLSRKKLAIASFFELALSLTSHLIVALVSFIIIFRFLSDDWRIYFYAFIFLLISCLVILHPKVLSFIFKRMLKFTRQKTFDVFDFLKYSDVVKMIILYFFPTILIGLAFMFLFFSIFGVQTYLGVAAICIFTLANFLAKLSILPPAGIGVREGVLVGLLILFLNFPEATLLTLSSRLLLVFVDICIIVMLWLVNFFIKDNKLKHDVFNGIN